MRWEFGLIFYVLTFTAMELWPHEFIPRQGVDSPQYFIDSRERGIWEKASVRSVTAMHFHCAVSRRMESTSVRSEGCGLLYRPTSEKAVTASTKESTIALFDKERMVDVLYCALRSLKCYMGAGVLGRRPYYLGWLHRSHVDMYMYFKRTSMAVISG